MRRLNSPALLIASCPVIASATYSRSVGCDRGLDRLQLVHQLVVDVQPAGGVDDDDVEAAVPRLGQRARRARAPDPARPPDRARARPPASPTTFSCSIAAGRRTSVDTSSGCRPCFASHSPELAGRRRLARALQAEQQDDARPRAASAAARPRRRRRAPASRRGRCATTCCAGVRLLRTSWSTARSRTRSMNALTTLKLTSASSSASRISRSAASTVCLGQPGLAAQGAEDVLQAVAERVEHGFEAGACASVPVRRAP